jgi:integral membrane sensor domain MASE1
MTRSQAVAPPSAQKTESRQAGLRQANLALLILLAVQFALGIGVNLYVTLPAAGHPGHASWFGNGALLGFHAALGMLLILGAIFVLVRAIMARNATLIVTSAAGLVAILLAAFFGSGFTDKLTDGYSLGMALATAVAFACYAIGLFAATRRSGPA